MTRKTFYSLLLLYGLGQCEAVVVEAIRDSLLQSATEVLLWPVRAAGEIMAFVAAELASAFEDILDSTNAAYELTSAKSSAAAAEFLNSLSPGKQASFMRKVFKGPVPREFFLEPWDARAEMRTIQAAAGAIHGFYVAGCVVLGVGFLSLFVFAILSAYQRDQRRHREWREAKELQKANDRKGKRQWTDPKRRRKITTPQRPRQPPQPQRLKRGAEDDEEEDVDDKRNGRRAIEDHDKVVEETNEERDDDNEVGKVSEEDNDTEENGYDGSEDEDDTEEDTSRQHESEDESNNHHSEDEDEDEDKSEEE